MENFKENNSKKPKGRIIAAFLGAITAILSIGIFHSLGHANKAFKTFLTLDSGVGPLSGKVVFGYILGFIAFGVFYFLLRKKQNANLTLWIILLTIALLLGSLFTFTPFVKWIA